MATLWSRIDSFGLDGVLRYVYFDGTESRRYWCRDIEITHGLTSPDKSLTVHSMTDRQVTNKLEISNNGGNGTL